MRRDFSISTAAIVVLLLPGLALAAPTAGACGLCGDGDGCHLQRPVGTATETHSCCDTDSEISPEPSLGSSTCECGREAPPAVTVDASSTVETAVGGPSMTEAIGATSPAASKFTSTRRPAAPPPAPPAYLIGCEFLT